MKVVLLIRYLQRSGAPKMILWLAGHLSEMGYEVTLYCFSNEITIDVPKSIKFIHEDLSHSNLIVKVLHLRRILSSEKADIAISFLLDANVYNIFACLGLRTKSVVCERNDPFKPGYYKLYFWRPWFRYADGAVYQLPKVAEYYSNIKGKTDVIPNPVNGTKIKINKTFSLRDDEIVSVGNLYIFQKRQDILIKAFAKFREKHPSYHLTIYGDGPEKDKKILHEIISELKLDGHVSLAGSVPNIAERIVNSKLFVFSSDFEGIPNALIEAMSIGLPCISTDCRPGGARLLIEEGVNGFIVPTGDADTLSEKMSYVVNHPNIADKIGKEAKNIVIRFSEDKIIRKWDNYLKSLMA